MHDHVHANTITGIGIACASLGGLFAQAAPGTVGVWGSVLALALLLVRAAHELGSRWLALQTARVTETDTQLKLQECEQRHANNAKLSSRGYCPLSPDGSPVCVLSLPGHNG